jgi:hypothetical protein
MSTYDKIAWLPLCGGLTGVGLVLSYLAMRRRGVRSGVRGAAWSLLPLAAYLTGAVEMFWKIGTAIGDFATGFVFSARVWSGIAVTGAAAVLFVVSGGLRRRSVRRGRGKQGVTPADGTPQSLSAATGSQPAAGSRQAAGSELATRPVTAAAAPQPAKARKGRKADADDDDLGDVADILRRHGIT